MLAKKIYFYLNGVEEGLMGAHNNNQDHSAINSTDIGQI
jgi:hypothetical protein